MKKKYILLLIIGIGGYFGYNYIYKKHRDISTETADYEVNASDLILEFSNDSNTAQSKYLDKTIIVTGNVSDKNENTITLNGSIFCSLLPDEGLKRASKNIYKVKGRCIGYDDLLEEIKLDQCSILTLN